MRIVFVQYGDYREASQRLAATGEETYYAQRYSVEFVAGLVARAEAVSVVCVDNEPHAELLPSGVRTLGLRLSSTGARGLLEIVAGERPTHLIARTPLPALLEWALRNEVRTLPMLADSFRATNLGARYGRWRLRRLLNRSAIAWVGNHNLGASRDLARIGVSARKIVPWDWPMVASPHDRAPKDLRTGSCDIIYVGQLAEAKGVGDVLRGLRELRSHGVPARLSIVGGGDAERFRAQAAELDLAGDVRFEGRIAHGRVIERMREHDVVVVPSRHEYPEGLPMTIYDALASRTPLVLSDHPMFTQRIVEGEGCLYFHAGSAEGLARRILELVGDAALYRKLSENATSVWESLRCPVVWGDLVSRWLSDTPEDRRWLEKRSLAAWGDSGANPGFSGSGRP